jgi:hypothetical protein
MAMDTVNVSYTDAIEIWTLVLVDLYKSSQMKHP